MAVCGVYHIISELKLQDPFDYWKCFCMSSETLFFISCLQFKLTFSFGKNITFFFYYQGQVYLIVKLSCCVMFMMYVEN